MSFLDFLFIVWTIFVLFGGIYIGRKYHQAEDAYESFVAWVKGVLK